MPRRQIIISAADVHIKVALLKTSTADAIWAALPFAGTVRTGGDEVFFESPVQVEREPDAKTVVDPGEIAYWPEDGVIAIGFGPTPLSRNGESRHGAPCNVWAKAIDDVRRLKAVQPGTKVMIDKASAARKH